jgi:hypothetical protein
MSAVSDLVNVKQPPSAKALAALEDVVHSGPSQIRVIVTDP